ncbi:hypothetical protein [Variovorax paradoxus]|uniref:Uncharacterized protein n=1 Tax=Variovorax paradoxus (strain EPS) TaxID=595537 RepID=E6V3Q3_VARPE|nr:hypothetical protein [Variovorax paradoxus]ADU36927.1 hypothetical protein Varpa_2729 [Variovorax paradoxus EPS]
MPATEYCFLWIDWWPLCMTKAEWSGWMQAIFSVAAIIAAGAFAMISIRATREDQISARREGMLSLITVVVTLTRLLSMEISARAARLDSSMDDAARDAFLAGDPFVDVLAAAYVIPLHEQPEEAQVRLVFALRRLVSTARETHSAIAKELNSSLGDFLLARQPFALILEGLADLERNCEKRATELR